MNSLTERIDTYKKYLDALNFQSTDTVCMWFSGDKNFFQSLDALRSSQAIERIIARNDAGQNVYLSMAAFQPDTTNRVKESVASVRHVWIDADANGPDVLGRIKKDITARVIPNFTVAVESSSGKVQVIWSVDHEDFLVNGKPDIAKQEALNRALAQRYKTDEHVVDTARVLRVPGFVNHKYDSKPMARLLEIGDGTLWKASDFKIAPAEIAVKKPVDATPTGEPIVDGGRNSMLTRIAGKLRGQGLSRELIEAHLLDLNTARCVPPLPDEDISVIAASVSRYEAGRPEDETVLTIGGKPMGSPSATAVEQAPALPEIDTREAALRPAFPYWVIDGTTIGEGLIKPALASSSKHAEFLFLPAVQCMVNSMYGKVRMKHQTVTMNLFVGLVSPYGKFFKSTSCELVHDYFKQAGLAAVYTPSMRNAGAKTIITGAGSPEGFGKLMSGLNCRNAVLYNDELGKFVAKAGIESSSFSSDLLTFYGSGEFNNTVKSARDSFAFESGSYCFSWLWCTTDRGFNRHWPKLAGISTGLEDRMFFCLGPEKPKENKDYQDPVFITAATETRKAVDAAIRQSVFEYEHRPAVQAALGNLDPRSMQLVQTLALYFAVDLRLPEVDNDCLERAKALVEYRNAVAAFLAPIEALNEQARLQKEIRRELRRNRGQMKYRELCRKLHYEDYGSETWGRAVSGLIKDGDAVQFFIPTPGSNRKTHMIGLARQDD